MALISCWQADEPAVSPCGGTLGRKPVWSLMMPAASSTRLWALMSWHWRRTGAAAAAPGNVAHVSKGRSSAGDVEGLLETQDGTESPASLWRAPQFPYFITHCWLTRPCQMFYFQLFKFWPAFLPWMQKDRNEERNQKRNTSFYQDARDDVCWGAKLT